MVDSGSLRLLDGSTGQPVEVSADRKQANAHPAAQLAANRLHYVQAFAAILDQAGNLLAFSETNLTTGP
jgi:hypothetical protein